MKNIVLGLFGVLSFSNVKQMFIIPINSSFINKHIDHVLFLLLLLQRHSCFALWKIFKLVNCRVAFFFASGLHRATECPSSGLHPGIEWSSSGPYFDGSFLVVDITFHSVIWTRNVLCVKQHTRQISLAYTPYLPVNGGDSVPKRCVSAMLDEGHCSGLHQSTRCD